MRDIKFRAWDKEEQSLSLVSEINFWNLGHVWAVTEDRYHHKIDGFKNYELMQYTGLKDKNGVEIYEGDIVQMLERTINGAEFIHICQVFQHESGLWRMEGTCASSGIKLPKTNMGLHSNQKRVEVIGNRYENPELLEG